MAYSNFLSSVIIFLFVYLDISKACIPGVPFGLPYYNPGYVAPYQYGILPYSKSRASNTHKNVESSSDACLSRFQNMKLTCSEPIAQESSITEEECNRLCLDEVHGCRSYQFFLDTGHCEVFSVRPPVRMDGIEQMPFAKDEILSEGSDSYSYKKRLKRQMCEPSIVPSIGSDVFVPNPNCMSLENMEFSSQTFVPSSIPNSPTLSANCDGSSARIQVIDGIAMNGDVLTKMRLVSKVQVDSADVCLVLCRNNAFLDGRKFESRCASVTFDRDTGLCLIFNDTISPSGNLEYAPTPSTVYFEKVCIPMSELSLGCDEAFYRIPQRITVAPPDAKLNAPTLNHCIRLCMNSLAQRGLQCRSIVYYSGQEWSTHNCLLHHHTRMTNPELIRSELQHEVDYVELPACIIHGRQHDEKPVDVSSSSWSEWSDCGPDLIRTRIRKHPSRNETEPCVPDKKFSEEFNAFFNEGDDSISDASSVDDLMDSSFRSPNKLTSLAPAKTFIDKSSYAQQSSQTYERPSNSQKPLNELYKNAPSSKDNHLASFSGPSMKSSPKDPTTNECDPRVRCCPYPSLATIERGCSIGYQITSENKREPCIPDECK